MGLRRARDDCVRARMISTVKKEDFTEPRRREGPKRAANNRYEHELFGRVHDVFSTSFFFVRRWRRLRLLHAELSL